MFGIACLDLNGNTLTYLTQWDLGQKVMFSNLGLSTAPIVHFHNRMLNSNEAVSVLATLDHNGNVIADIPNFLLQKPYPIAIHICESRENVITTVASSYISVRAKNKPSNYNYVENITYTTLDVFYDNVDAEIKNILYGIKDGSPKGAFASVSDLNGKDSGVYVNTTDGYIYYWDGTDISDKIVQYQSTGIADGSVTFNLLSDELQNNLQTTQEDVQAIENRFNSTYRNHVLGFKSPFSFDIQISDEDDPEKRRMSVAFTLDEGAADGSSLVWGNNSYYTIPDVSFTCIEYEDSLLDNKHIALMYSPTKTENCGLYWLKLNRSVQVTNDDYIIMTIFLKNDVIRHIIACDDVLNKIFVGGEKYTNEGSIEEDVQGLQDNLQTAQEDISILKEGSQVSKESIQATQEDIQTIENRFNSTYRNYVQGFRSSFNFYIDTQNKRVTFKPEPNSSSIMWGENAHANVFGLVDSANEVHEYEADYSSFLASAITSNIIMLMYSPSTANSIADDGTADIETRKTAFYFKSFTAQQTTEDDYVVMVLYVSDTGDVSRVTYIVACDDVLNKIFVNGEKYTNADSTQEAVQGLQNNLQDTQDDVQGIEDRFNSTYRNHVLGFKSSHNFYIDTESQEVTFMPESTSVIYGNNTSAYIYKFTETADGASVTGTYTASYAEFLSGTQTTNIIMLMYSPNAEIRKSAFYFKQFDKNQITNDDYVVMILRINQDGVLYAVACDDVLGSIFVGEGEDRTTYTKYANTNSVQETIQIMQNDIRDTKNEVKTARKAYGETTPYNTLAEHLYSLGRSVHVVTNRYRNYCQHYKGDLSLTINTDINNLETGNTILVKALNTGIVYGNNSYTNIQKETEGYDEVNYWNLINPSSGGGIFCLLWSVSNRKFYAIKYSSGSIPESPDDPIICTIYVSIVATVTTDETTGKETVVVQKINVTDIAACDVILDSIYVNDLKWIEDEIFSTPYNLNTCAIFDRVCCIGDSATAGHIDYGYASDGSLSTEVKIRRNEKYAWPAFMAKLTGNEYINLGISGATALTWLDGTSDATDDGASFNNIDKTIRVKAEWLATAYDESGSLIKGAFETVEEKTDANGTTKKYIVYERTVENTDTISAYLIGLGMNDTLNTGTEGNLVDGGTGTPKLVLSTNAGNPAADIGTNYNSFYGKYSELIEKIHSVSPQAHIFVQTMHDNLNDRRLEYNEAIKYIANYYSAREEDPIPVHVLDLYKYRNLYKIDSIINSKLGGHWNPVGYQQFAEILRRIWSEYINNHASEFKDVHLT